MSGLNAKQLEEVFLKATEKIFGKPDSENFEDFKYDLTEFFFKMSTVTPIVIIISTLTGDLSVNVLNHSNKSLWPWRMGNMILMALQKNWLVLLTLVLYYNYLHG